jgi:hypothetical protein
MQPWAAALTKERMTGVHAGEESDAHCLPQGVPKIDVDAAAFQDYSKSGRSDYPLRGVRPVPADLPGWTPTSERSQSLVDGLLVGKWDGDALVVETSGFNGKTWLDQAGIRPRKLCM